MSFRALNEQKQDLQKAGQRLVDSMVSGDFVAFQEAWENACLYFDRASQAGQHLESLRSLVRRL